jgi:TPR/MLP1/MLP2-like protein.
LRVTYSEVQRKFEIERNAWTNDKKTLEDTIVDMSTSEKHSESDRTSRESEVRQQEERAKASACFYPLIISHMDGHSQQAAEERYTHEVVAHAESIKAIEALKRQFANIQATARHNATIAETATVKLATSEGSWKQQKEALDKEVADLNTRLDLFL